MVMPAIANLSATLAFVNCRKKVILGLADIASMVALAPIADITARGKTTSRKWRMSSRMPILGFKYLRVGTRNQTRRSPEARSLSRMVFLRQMTKPMRKNTRTGRGVTAAR